MKSIMTRIDIIVLTCTVLIYAPSFSHSTYCPSAEEGKSYAIKCKSKGQSHWQMVAHSDGPSEGEMVCSSHYCNWGNFGNVRVEIRRESDSYISLLNISHVSPVWRNHSIQCTAGEKINSSCQMDIYHKPDSAGCEASKIDHDKIRFMCWASRIFPELRCQVTQYESANRTTINISQGFSYKNHIMWNNQTRYYESSCTVEISNLSPGSYQYFGILIPDVNFDGYVRNMSLAIHPTIPVIIEAPKLQLPQPYVFIESPKLFQVHTCPGSRMAYTFICHARNFEMHPHFQWLLVDANGNQSLNESNMANYFSAHNSSSMSKYTIQLEDQHTGKHIVCSASSFNYSVYDKFRLRMKFLPTPYFIHSDGRHINNTLLINHNDKHTLTCKLDSSEAETYMLHVKCHENLTEKTILGNAITFFLKGSYAGETFNCTCRSVHFEQQCMNIIHIKISPILDFITTFHIPQKSNIFNSGHMPYFVGAVIMLCLIAVTVILCLTLQCSRETIWSYCRHRENRQDNSHTYEEVRHIYNNT